MKTIDPLRSPVHTYIQIANVIAERIEQGQYTVQLPSERALMAEFGVAYMTVRHALEILRDRGLVVTRQGRGSFVAAWVLANSTEPRQPTTLRN